MSKQQRNKKRNPDAQPPIVQKQEVTSLKPQNSKILWITLGIIIFAQVIFTLNSMNQIRYEELAESVRNVYWLDQNTVYDGTSSNIGWYGSLLAFYKMFGFSIHSAKFFRLFLDITSLLCVALILKRFLTPKQAIVPLVAIGFSPTLLYITTMQHSHGIDLQYAPIVLYLALSLHNAMPMGFFFKSILLWMVAMIAWMSYPTFIFYLVPLSIIYFWQVIQNFNRLGINTIFSGLLASLIAFFLPLIIGLSYLKDPQLIIYDTVTKSGIFRGAGSLHLEFTLFFTNLIGAMNDLFYRGNSYNFETAQGDFSYYLPILSIVLVFGFTLTLISNKSLRIYVLCALLLIVSNLIVSGFTVDPSLQPGIRRTTGALFGFYCLYSLTWGYIMKYPSKNSLILIVILLIIPVHNLVVFPQNLSALSFPSQYAEGQWFKIAQTPSQSLKVMIDAVTKDELKLGCKDEASKNFIPCRYSEAFAAVSGYCTWNNQSCNFVSGYDLNLKQQIPLSIDLWENYQIQH